jgi:hypothetical protein
VHARKGNLENEEEESKEVKTQEEEEESPLHVSFISSEMAMAEVTFTASAGLYM